MQIREQSEIEEGDEKRRDELLLKAQDASLVKVPHQSSNHLSSHCGRGVTSPA